MRFSSVAVSAIAFLVAADQATLGLALASPKKTDLASTAVPMDAPSNVLPALDISRFDRRIYTGYDTPLEPMPELSKALGGKVNLWIKRDDKLGLTGGGNKTRKLEYAMADAIKNGADTIITCGAVQSNHCRLTLSACIKEGLKCSLVLEERVPGSYKPEASGNNYLFRLLGAEKIEKVGLGEAPAGMEKMAEELRAEGRNVYCVPGGASNEIGALGYVACAQEMRVSYSFRSGLL